MPYMSRQFDSRTGLILILGVAPADTLQQPVLSGATPRITNFTALIDSVADVTCISARFAKTAGLRPTGKRPVAGVR